MDHLRTEPIALSSSSLPAAAGLDEPLQASPHVDVILTLSAAFQASPADAQLAAQLQERVVALQTLAEGRERAPANPLPLTASLAADQALDLAAVTSSEACLGLLHICLRDQRWADVAALQALGAERWPSEPGLRYAEAQRLRMQGVWDEAKTTYLAFLQLQPDTANAWANLGVCHINTRDFALAARCFERALKASPRHLFAWQHLAISLHHAGAHAAALELFWFALAMDTNASLTLNWLCIALFPLRNPDAKQRERFLALCPSLAGNTGLDAETLGNLAATALRLKLHAEAAELAARSLALEPGPHNNAHTSQFGAAMAQGDLATGWPALEQIWTDQRAANLGLVGPAWQGQPLAGDTLLLYATGGYGDTVQFSRFLHRVVGGRVVLICQDELVGLLRPNFPQVRIVTAEEWLQAPEPYRYQMRLMSLPYAMRLHTMAALGAEPYLAVPAAAREAWAAQLGEHDGPRVGLVWRGNPNYARDIDRSVPLASLAALGRLAGARYYSLQKGPEAQVDIQAIGADGWLQDVSAQLNDFTATAGLIQQLDLVITVDTSVAHVAAASGCEVWLMIDDQACWRWFNSASSTPWYANMRLFKQDRMDDWQPVVEAVYAALRERLAGGSTPGCNPGQPERHG